MRAAIKGPLIVLCFLVSSLGGFSQDRSQQATATPAINQTSALRAQETALLTKAEEFFQSRNQALDSGDSASANAALSQAIQTYREILQINPANKTAWVRIGTVYASLKNWGEALSTFQKVLELDPTDDVVHNMLGALFEVKGDLDASLREYQTALKLRPEKPEYHFNVGSALVDNQDFKNAVVALREANRLKPDHADAHWYLGGALRELGDLDGAIEEFRRALTLKVNPISVSRIHASLGFALYDKGDFFGAVSELKAAVQATSGSSPQFEGIERAYAILGDSLYRLDRFKDAIEACTQAVRIDVKNVTARTCLAWSHLALNDVKSAQSEYQLLKILDSKVAEQLIGEINRTAVRVQNAVVGSQVLWADTRGGDYSFSLQNQLEYPVKRIHCRVVFYDRSGNVVETDEILYEGPIPPKLARRVSSRVDPAVHAITIAGSLFYTQQPTTRIEVRVLDFEIVR